MARRSAKQESQENQSVATRQRKPMSLNSVPTILKKVDGVLSTIAEKEGITRSEKLDLGIIKMYLMTLTETVNEILGSKSTVKQQPPVQEVSNATPAVEYEDEDDD